MSTDPAPRRGRHAARLHTLAGLLPASAAENRVLRRFGHDVADTAHSDPARWTGEIVRDVVDIPHHAHLPRQARRDVSEASTPTPETVSSPGHPSGRTTR